MKASVLSEEGQCTCTQECKTYLCLLYCIRIWQFSNDKRMLRCFPSPLTSSLDGGHFETVVFFWFCSNDHKMGLSVHYTCSHLQVWNMCQILSRPRLELYILYLLDPDCNYRVISQLRTNYGIMKHVLSGIRLIDGSCVLVGST